jgi:NADH dehydrogenase
MTILVTGGTGFVGPNVVHALRAEERPVRVLARKPDKQDQLRAWGCELVQGDMTDADSLRRAVEGCEAVVHLVAVAPFADPKATQRVMEQGTRDLLTAAKEAGVGRFALMSALGTSERTKDLAPYFHAKWDEEQAVKKSGLEHTIFRPSFIFGRDGGMLPTLIRLVRWSPVTPVAGSPRPARSTRPLSLAAPMSSPSRSSTTAFAGSSGSADSRSRCPRVFSKPARP